jgi:hypothetical protein
MGVGMRGRSFVVGRSRARRVLAAGLVPLAGIGVLAGSASAASAGRIGHTTTVSTSISSVASIPGGSGAWAVGTRYSSSTGLSAVMWKWSGGKWVSETLPSLGGASLGGVAATSSTSAWAVGSVGATPFLLHFDGTSWKKISVPSADATDYFGAIAAKGTTVWIGGAAYSSSSSTAVLLSYDGSWHTLTLPSSNGFIQSLSTRSTSGLWIIQGNCGSSSCSFHVLKPTGSSWTSTTVGKTGTTLNAISAHSATGVLAVGSFTSPTVSSPPTVARTELFNGSTWTSASPPMASADGSFQFAVLTGDTSGWAAGTQNNAAQTSYHPLVDEMVSSKWSQRTVTIPGKNGFLDAFGAASTSNAWVFVTSWSGAVCASTPTLVADHWNGTSWTSASHPAALPSGGAGVTPHC